MAQISFCFSVLKEMVSLSEEIIDKTVKDRDLKEIIKKEQKAIFEEKSDRAKNKNILDLIREIDEILKSYEEKKTINKQNFCVLFGEIYALFKNDPHRSKISDMDTEIVNLIYLTNSVIYQVILSLREFSIGLKNNDLAERRRALREMKLKSDSALYSLLMNFEQNSILEKKRLLQLKKDLGISVLDLESVEKLKEQYREYADTKLKDIFSDINSIIDIPDTIEFREVITLLYDKYDINCDEIMKKEFNYYDIKKKRYIKNNLLLSKDNSSFDGLKFYFFLSIKNSYLPNKILGIKEEERKEKKLSMISNAMIYSSPFLFFGSNLVKNIWQNEYTRKLNLGMKVLAKAFLVGGIGLKVKNYFDKKKNEKNQQKKANNPQA